MVRATAELFLGRGKIVGTIGGDHSISFGAIEAHAARYPGLGLLHFHAHADLRRAYEGFEWSHASMMENVMRRLPGVARLVQVGIRDLCEEEHLRIASSGGRIVAFYDAELAERRVAGETWAQQCARMVDALPPQVYVSFDIDGLDPALCPHMGTKVPGGLRSRWPPAAPGHGRERLHHRRLRPDRGGACPGRQRMGRERGSAAALQADRMDVAVAAVMVGTARAGVLGGAPTETA